MTGNEKLIADINDPSAFDTPPQYAAFGLHNPAFYVLWITIDAAIAASQWTGKGDKVAADHAATAAMRRRFRTVPFAGVIGSGEGLKDGMDARGMLIPGEKLGMWAPGNICVDIAVDPLDGTKLCANDMPGAVTVIAFGEENSLARFPDCKIRKCAVGYEARDAILLEKGIVWNLSALAEAKKKLVSDLTVVMLDRPRHAEYIAQARSVGARVKLISDGDLMPAVATYFPKSGIDMLWGMGGGPEGIIAAAALKCLGGGFQAQATPADAAEARLIEEMSGEKADFVWRHNQLCRAHCMFAATGVTNGDLLNGVDYDSMPGRVITHSLLTRSETGSIYRIENSKRLDEASFQR